ncbi:MAG: PAS domain-containing protein, partial [Thermoplasmatota archaeon]
PEKFVIVSRDITERKKTEKKLKEAEKLYKNIFENTGNPTMIIKDDETISLVNREFTDLTGYSKEEVENEMELSDFIVEEDYRKIKEYHKNRRENPDSTPEEYSFKIINKFGHPIDVYCKVGLIPNSTNRITSIIDVSKYRETMEELRKCQETFRVIFENLSYDMILLDSDLNIIEINPKLMDTLLYNGGELSDKSIFDIIPSNSKQRIKESKEKLQKQESDTERQRIKIINKDDEKMDFIMTMSVVLDTQKEPIYFICDIQKE